MRPSIAILAAMLFSLMSSVCSALIIGGPSKQPVTDKDWPLGSLELANLPSRIGWLEGPAFGGGQMTFYYQGDASALQTALDQFAALKAPRVELVVHAGPKTEALMRERPSRPRGGPTTYEIKPDPATDPRIDWTFTVWTPENWYRLHSNDRLAGMLGQESGDRSLPAPRIDAYVGGGGIDFSQVKLAAAIVVTEERASAAGFANGPVLAGDVYDMHTSKPVPGAQITVDRYDNEQRKYLTIAEADTDPLGHFTITGFAPGSARVVVSADKYATRLAGFAMLSADSLKRYTVQLAEAATIRGQVVDSNGAPVPGAGVQTLSIFGADATAYLRPDEVLKATADEKGAFAMAGLPRGFVMLTPQSGTMYPMNMDQRFAVPSGDVVLRMAVTGSIRGTVVGEVIGRLPGMQQIFVYNRGDSNAFIEHATARLGETFTIQRVPPGEYYITADVQAYTDRSAVNATPVSVKAGETTKVDVRYSQ
jgi:hypothetical protein